MTGGLYQDLDDLCRAAEQAVARLRLLAAEMEGVHKEATARAVRDWADELEQVVANIKHPGPAA